jgi:hypothetical protein
MPQALQALHTLPTYDHVSSFFTCSRSSTNVTIAGILLNNSLGTIITSPLSGYITNGLPKIKLRLSELIMEDSRQLRKMACE